MRHGLLILLAALTTDPAAADEMLRTTIPFRLEEHLMVIRTSIGDLDGIELAIDTGAATSIISPGLAKRLGLKSSATEEVLILGKRMRIKEVRVPRLCLGDLCYDDVPMRISPMHSVPVEGLLGFDVLRRNDFAIDFESRQIHLGQVAFVGTSQRSAPQLPFLVARLTAGEKTLCLLLDSGCGDLVLFRRRIRDSLRMERTGQTVRLEASGVTLKAELVYLESATLGEYQWKGLRAFLVDDRSTDRYGTLDGILGLGSMNLARLSFDSQHHRVFWEK